jgi:fatty-acyl-CoA synthase
MRDAGIGSWLRRRERLSPDDVAVIEEDHQQTFAEVAARAYRLAHVLRGLGVDRGDRVAFLGRNSADFVATLVATTSLGAIFVPLNWRLAVPELAYVVADAGARVLLHDPDLADTVAAVADDPGVDLDHLVARGGELEQLLAGAEAEWVDVAVDLEDPALIIYTSGTTGRPKGAMLSHGNVTWNCVNVLIDTGLSADEVALVSAPMFHVAALNMVAMPALMTGGTTVFMDRFEPGAVLDLIARHGVTVMFGVPAMFNALSQHPGWDQADLSSMRRALCGGAPVPLATIHTWLDRGVTFLQGYGMTETSPGALFLGPRRAEDKAGTAGVASFFTDVEVRRPNGTPVDAGERGEVVVSGPNVMLGYWKRPEATAEVIRDGWFHSGDVAVVDDEGYVTIVDRLKDMYVSGGENVYPAEVEDALFTHEAVADCAVIGVPDDTWGEVGRALVVPRSSTRPSAEELVSHLEGRLARYKIPASFVLVDELPRSGAGKLLKPVLRATYGGPRGSLVDEETPA